MSDVSSPSVANVAKRSASVPCDASKRTGYSVTNVSTLGQAGMSTEKTTATVHSSTNGTALMGQNQSNSFNSNGGNSGQIFELLKNLSYEEKESIFKTLLNEQLAKKPTDAQSEHFDVLAREYLSFSDKIAALPSIATNYSPEKLPEDWHEKWPEEVLKLQQEIRAYFDNPVYSSDVSPITDKVWERLPKALHDYKNKLYRPSDKTTKRILLSDLLVQLGKILSEYKKTVDEGLKKTVVDFIGPKVRCMTLDEIIKKADKYEYKRLSIINKRHTRSKSAPSKTSIDAEFAALHADIKNRDTKIATLRAGVKKRDTKIATLREALQTRDVELTKCKYINVLCEKFSICLAHKLGISTLSFKDVPVTHKINGEEVTTPASFTIDCSKLDQKMYETIDKVIEKHLIDVTKPESECAVLQTCDAELIISRVKEIFFAKLASALAYRLHLSTMQFQGIGLDVVLSDEDGKTFNYKISVETDCSNPDKDMLNLVDNFISTQAIDVMQLTENTFPSDTQDFAGFNATEINNFLSHYGVEGGALDEANLSDTLSNCELLCKEIHKSWMKDHSESLYYMYAFNRINANNIEDNEMHLCYEYVFYTSVIVAIKAYRKTSDESIKETLTKVIAFLWMIFENGEWTTYSAAMNSLHSVVRGCYAILKPSVIRQRAPLGNTHGDVNKRFTHGTKPRQNTSRGNVPGAVTQTAGYVDVIDLINTHPTSQPNVVTQSDTTQKNASQPNPRQNASQTKPPVTRDEIFSIAENLSSVLFNAKMEEKTLGSQKKSAIDIINDARENHSDLFCTKNEKKTLDFKKLSADCINNVYYRKLIVNYHLLSVINAYKSTTDDGIKEVLAKVFNYTVYVSRNYENPDIWNNYFSNSRQLSKIVKCCRENTQSTKERVHSQPPDNPPKEGEVEPAGA